MARKSHEVVTIQPSGVWVARRPDVGDPTGLAKPVAAVHRERLPEAHVVPARGAAKLVVVETNLVLVGSFGGVGEPCAVPNGFAIHEVGGIKPEGVGC